MVEHQFQPSELQPPVPSGHPTYISSDSVVVILVLLKIFAFLTLWVPSWIFVLIIGELIACYPLVSPVLKTVEGKIGHLNKKLDGAVEKLYNLIPRYNMHRMG